jgi:hypothetical protein
MIGVCSMWKQSIKPPRMAFVVPIHSESADVRGGLTKAALKPNYLKDTEYTHLQPQSTGVVESRKPDHRIKEAYAICRDIRSGSMERGGEERLAEMLDPSTLNIKYLSPMSLTRAVRATAVLSRHICSTRASAILEELLGEASRPDRVRHFSMMDISELLHSFSTLLQGSVNPSIEASISGVSKTLFQELFARENYIKVRLIPRVVADQTLSIQALSNIVYSLKLMRCRFPDSFVAEELHLKRILCDILAFHSDSDSLKSCQVFHLVGLLEACVGVTEYPNRVRAIKKILREIERKTVIGLVDTKDQRFLNLKQRAIHLASS